MRKVNCEGERERERQFVRVGKLKKEEMKN